MVSLEELANANITDLPLRDRTNAFFAGTEQIAAFVDEVMIPLLRGLMQPNDKEQAIICTYYRMCLVMRAIKALNNVQHFQTVASTVRSLFELWLDIRMLAADSKGDLVRGYHAFPEIERYRVAEQLTSYANQHPGAIKLDLTPQITFLQNSAVTSRVVGSKIKSRAGKLDFPSHWSGVKSIRARAAKLGLEADYVEMYPLLSWYVHSGSTGVAGLSSEALESCFALCHRYAQRMFLDATVECARVTRIREATIDHFGRWIEELRLKPGFVITELQINQIREAKKASAG